MSKKLQKAIFLDRDGVINKEKQYVHKIEDFDFIPGVFEGLRKLKRLDYKLIIITNQAGIAKGYYKEKDLFILHEFMLKKLKLNGVDIDSIYYCPHHPEAKIEKYRIDCDCRKPKPGLLLKAAYEKSIDLEKSIMIGDKISDYEAGINAKLRLSLLVKSGHKIQLKYLDKLNFIFDDLLSTVHFIESLEDID